MAKQSQASPKPNPAPGPSPPRRKRKQVRAPFPVSLSVELVTRVAGDPHQPAASGVRPQRAGGCLRRRRSRRAGRGGGGAEGGKSGGKEGALDTGVGPPPSLSTAEDGGGALYDEWVEVLLRRAGARRRSLAARPNARPRAPTPGPEPQP